MKNKFLRRLLPCSLLSLAAAILLPAADPPPAPASAEVGFSHPEKFTDLKDGSFDTDNRRGQERYLPLLREDIGSWVKAKLPAGQKLTITFTDIDLAGDYEPWLGARFDDVRIVRDVYLPRLNFHFQLTDDHGKVLQEGERRLVDVAFQMRIPWGFGNEPLRYEETMLRDWMSRELVKGRS